MNRIRSFYTGAACAVIISMAGCNNRTDSGTTNSGGAVANSTDQQTVVTAMPRASAPSRPGTPGNRPANSVATTATRSSDTSLTGPIVQVTGKVTFTGGKPVTSATIEAKGWVMKSVSSYEMETMASTSVEPDGTYRLTSPDSRMGLALNVLGDFPEVAESLESNRKFNSDQPSVRRLKKDITIPQGFDVAGTVVDAAGAPFPGATVHIKPVRYEGDIRVFKHYETTSTASGEFQFPHLAGAGWIVGAAAPGFAPVTKSITVPTTEPLSLALASRGGTVHGTVVTKAEGQAVAGMNVRLGTSGPNLLSELEGQVKLSGPNGQFVFENVSEGEKVVRADHNPELNLGMSMPFPGPVKLGEGETTDVAVFVYPGHSLRGIVFDKDTSDPLSQVALSISGGGVARSTDVASGTDGSYKVSGLFPDPSGQFRISAKLDGYAIDQPHNQPIGVTASEDTLDMYKDVPMVRLLKVRGIVVDREDAPIAHARVKVISMQSWSSEGGVPVASDGTFELEIAPFSKGLIEAEAAGFAPGQSEGFDTTTEDLDDVKVVLDIGSTIHGTVYEPGGKPAAGAKVNVNRSFSFAGSSMSRENEMAVSGENGTFTLVDAPAESILSATKEDFAKSESLTVNVKPGATHEGAELHLRTAMKIAGKVVWKAGGPVENANIWAYNNTLGSNSRQTKSNGTFELDGLAEGAYTLNVSAKGLYKSVEGIKTGTMDLEIILGEEEHPGKIIGIVVDDATGDPITDFTVSGSGNPRQLEKTNEFEMTNLQIGMGYSINLSSPDTIKQEFTAGPVTSNAVMRQTFRLGKGGAITGRVIERGTGKPMSGITVVNQGSNNHYSMSSNKPVNHTVTDDEGKFSLAPAPAGENTITVNPRAPLTPAYKQIIVRHDAIADVGDIEIGLGGTIRGLVIRGSRSDPAIGVTVRMTAHGQGYQVNKSVTTDEEGRFEVSGLMPASYSVQVDSISKSVAVTPEGVHDVEIRIGGVTVKGTVTRGGVPASVGLRATGPDGTGFNTYAQNGAYEVKSVLPGTYEFTVGYGRNPYKETVEIPDQSLFEKDFVLSDGGIVVTVLDTAGQPVPGVAVSVSQKAAGTGFQQNWLQSADRKVTNSAGTADYNELGEGTYSVSANHEEKGSAMNSNVTVQKDQKTNVELRLSPDGGTLVSVALNYSTGAGIPDAWCYLHGPNGSFPHGSTRDAAGIMTIRNIPPGTYTTNVSYWSFSQSERQIEIKAGETVNIDDVLYPAGALHWTLRRANGTAADGADVTVTPIATDPEEQPRAGRTASSGLFVQRGLAPGTYQVTARLPGKSEVTETFVVNAGDNTQKERTVNEW